MHVKVKIDLKFDMAIYFKFKLIYKIDYLTSPNYNLDLLSFEYKTSTFVMNAIGRAFTLESV